jgi:hypothetical protein
MNARDMDDKHSTSLISVWGQATGSFSIHTLLSMEYESTRGTVIVVITVLIQRILL